MQWRKREQSKDEQLTHTIPVIQILFKFASTVQVKLKKKFGIWELQQDKLKNSSLEEFRDREIYEKLLGSLYHAALKYNNVFSFISTIILTMIIFPDIFRLAFEIKTKECNPLIFPLYAK